jgi:hypothetical protein
LVNILLRAPNSDAYQLGKRLGEIGKECQRDGFGAKSLQGIQDHCRMLVGLAHGRAELSMEAAEHQKFVELLDTVFNASNPPEPAQAKDSSASTKEKADAESPSKARVKRKIRSGESPGSTGADKKKSKLNLEISVPKLTSPYPTKVATAMATTGDLTTTTTTASIGIGPGASHSGSTDSPPVSPRRGFGISATTSPPGLAGGSASLLGRIANNLSTFATQFETLVEFGHAIDRSKWSAIQDAQKIVESLLELEGQPISQFGRTNEIDKLSHAITVLNTALQSAEKSAEDLNHRDFDKIAFQKHAKRMAGVLKNIQSKLADLQSATGQPTSPRSPSEFVGRLRSSSGGAKAHPSLSTFGRKAGKSILQGGYALSPMSPQGDAPTSPRAGRPSMLVSVPVPHLAMNVGIRSTTANTRTVASLTSPPSAAPVSLTPGSPSAAPTSPRAVLGAQKRPQRLRPSALAGDPDQSIATLKAALGKYSMRNLMQGYAVDGNNVVPTGAASSTANTASSTIAATPTQAVADNAEGDISDLRALLSGISARNLLQRFRAEVGDVVANDGAQAPVNTRLPTQVSGDLTDTDIDELVKKVSEGDTELIGDLISSLEEALRAADDDVSAQSLEDTVIVSSSSDEDKSVHDDDGTTGA